MDSTQVQERISELERAVWHIGALARSASRGTPDAECVKLLSRKACRAIEAAVDAVGGHELWEAAVALSSVQNMLHQLQKCFAPESPVAQHVAFGKHRCRSLWRTLQAAATAPDPMAFRH